uniref:J domain-containing protein n=1 Tax=Euplotes harpa TaxID=151035 RepID=A0A7S3N5G2_9SPIT|mmetsp:Transcript_13406/g.15547  ORF Transcript_13406/g.15547 Transcript_13406/m.15547 type:complete len:172 (+) Transcript_13406:702-1217(+)
MNHDFKISVHRNPDKVWCSYCKKDLKSEEKKQKEEELDSKIRQQMENQQKLFQESKSYVQSETYDHSERTNNQITLQEILKEVNEKAQLETKNYMQLHSLAQDESSVFQVYKIIYMPSEILQVSFKSLGDGLNSCFRKMAVVIHPDKNSHPLSNKAFQKLSQAYFQCQQSR